MARRSSSSAALCAVAALADLATRGAPTRPPALRLACSCCCPPTAAGSVDAGLLSKYSVAWSSVVVFLEAGMVTIKF